MIGSRPTYLRPNWLTIVVAIRKASGPTEDPPTHDPRPTGHCHHPIAVLRKPHSFRCSRSNARI